MRISASGCRRGEDKYPDGAAHQVSQRGPGNPPTVKISWK
jgi:hypothetical protein